MEHKAIAIRAAFLLKREGYYVKVFLDPSFNTNEMSVLGTKGNIIAAFTINDSTGATWFDLRKMDDQGFYIIDQFDMEVPHGDVLEVRNYINGEFQFENC